MSEQKQKSDYIQIEIIVKSNFDDQGVSVGKVVNVILTSLHNFLTNSTLRHREIRFMTSYGVVRNSESVILSADKPE